MTAAIEGANSGSGRGRRVPGPGVWGAVSAACGPMSRCSLLAGEPTYGWASCQHRASYGSWSQINQLPHAGATRAKRAAQTARSIRKDHNELSTTPPDRRRRDLPRRMTGCASLPEKTVPSRCNNSTRVRVRIPARVLPDPACRSSTSGSRRARRTSDRRPSAPGCGPATSPHRCSD